VSSTLNTDEIRYYHTGEFIRLQRLITRHSGFQLILAEHNSVSYRETLLKKLRDQSLPTTVWQLNQPVVSNLLAFLKSFSVGQMTVHITGLEENAGANDDFLSELNLVREQIANEFQNGLVVWLSTPTIQSFAHNAPDLWAWRSSVFSFLLKAESDTNLMSAVDRPANLLSDEKRARLVRLQAYLEHAEPGDHTSLWLEAADIERKLGDLEASLQSSERALDQARLNDDKLGVAMARGTQADILQAQGELDEALRIRREVQLPVYERLGEVRSIAITMGKIADTLQSRGELDEALRSRREEELPVFERLGDVRNIAITKGKIADILQARGELDEALRIRREEELPVLERLGEVRDIAITKGKIADILQARGELDEALRIRREEELPVFEILGDVREIAFTKGQIADILLARGELDEALHIRREDQLPIYERLGEVREIAFTKGKIADILQTRGELDEALRSRREEELPVYERLGEVRDIAYTKGKIADILLARGKLDEALRIRREEELPIYERLGEVPDIAHTKGKIADILQARGKLDEALSIRREEELPVFERLGEVRSIAVTKGKIADILQTRGKLDEALSIRREEELPVFERLDDSRSVAITKGKIADILLARGELDEAEHIWTEVQHTLEKLGDRQSLTYSSGQLALCIYQLRGLSDEVLTLLTQALQHAVTLQLPSESKYLLELAARMETSQQLLIKSMDPQQQEFLEAVLAGT